MDDEAIIFNEFVSPVDLKKFERVYYDELEKKKSVSKETQFEYAYCLVRSKFPTDVRKGLVILEELFRNHSEHRRDYLYYLALGQARIKEYTIALHFCREFLHIEPSNTQVQALEKAIRNKMTKEGQKGLIAAAIGTLVIGGIVGLGVALSKSSTPK